MRGPNECARRGFLGTSMAALAAGAIYPRQGFAHAFTSGADFLAVAMFDFQLKENCELVRRLVAREKNRPRPWRA